MPKKTPRQARARATYDSIVDAAARLLTTRGYGGFTTNHVAEVAGVAIGSLYEYFPDKETIVAEVARRVVLEIVDEVTTALEGALAGDQLSGMRDWVHAMFGAVSRRRELVRAIWRDVPFLRELDEIRRLRDTFIALAARGQPLAPGHPLLHEHPEAMTYLLTIMTGHAIVEGVVARPRNLQLKEVEECFQKIVALLFAQR